MTNEVLGKDGEAPAAAVDARVVEDFVHDEIDLLDAREFEAWCDLFTEDGAYWAPVDPKQDSPLTHVSLFFDDKRTLRTRIMRLRHPRIHVQIPASRTAHVVSKVRLLSAVPGDLRARCKFVMVEFRASKGQTVYGGTYEYRFAVSAQGELRIREKKVILVNSEDAFPSLAVWF